MCEVSVSVSATPAREMTALEPDSLAYTPLPLNIFHYLITAYHVCSRPPVAIFVWLSQTQRPSSPSKQATLTAIMASSTLPACLQAK